MKKDNISELGKIFLCLCIPKDWGNFEQILENLETAIKKSQADISVANEKYWQLKNHALNEIKKVEQQKNLKQQRENTQKQLLQEEIETVEIEKKRADLKKRNPTLRD